MPLVNVKQHTVTGTPLIQGFVLFRNHATLRVREHKILGPYVEGLTKLVVSSFKVCMPLTLNSCHLHYTVSTENIHAM